MDEPSRAARTTADDRGRGRGVGDAPGPGVCIRDES